MNVNLSKQNFRHIKISEQFANLSEFFLFEKRSIKRYEKCIGAISPLISSCKNLCLDHLNLLAFDLLTVLWYLTMGIHLCDELNSITVSIVGKDMFRFGSNIKYSL